MKASSRSTSACMWLLQVMQCPNDVEVCGVLALETGVREFKTPGNAACLSYAFYCSLCSFMGALIRVCTDSGLNQVICFGVGCHAYVYSCFFCCVFVAVFFVLNSHAYTPVWQAAAGNSKCKFPSESVEYDGDKIYDCYSEQEGGISCSNHTKEFVTFGI